MREPKTTPSLTRCLVSNKESIEHQGLHKVDALSTVEDALVNFQGAVAQAGWSS